MEFFLIAIVATLTLALDYILKLDEARRGQKWLKLGIALGALSLVWIISGIQYLNAKEANQIATNNTNFIKDQLVAANVSLSNTSAALSNEVAISMRLQEELAAFRKQSDKDQVVLAGNVIQLLSPSEDSREFGQGVFALYTGRRDKAKTHFRHAIALNPNHSRAHNNLALLMREDGLHDQAFRHFQLAFESDTNNAVAAMNYASRLSERGQFGKALEVISAPNNLAGLTDANLLSYGTFLAVNGSTNAWKFLDRYMVLAETPTISDVAAPLSKVWKLLSESTKEAVTNWISKLPTDLERRQFQAILEQLRNETQ